MTAVTGDDGTSVSAALVLVDGAGRRIVPLGHPGPVKVEQSGHGPADVREWMAGTGFDLVFEVPDGAISSVDGAVSVRHDRVSLWVTGGSTGPAPLPLPPFDVASSPHLAALPAIPGATVSCQYSLTDAPLGDIDYLQRIVDGRVVEMTSGWVADADVYVELPYVNYLRLRLGRSELLEALEGGSLKGDIVPLSVLSGILESVEFQMAWSANTTALQMLHDLLADGVDLLTDESAIGKLLA